MDIKVNGRTLSDRPLVLGVQGDNNVEELRFLVPRYTDAGVDLSLGIGYAVFRLPDGTDGHVSLTPEVLDTDENTVSLTLLVGSQMTEQKGSGKLCLKVAGLESAMWSSAICDMFVNGTIAMPSPQPYSLFRTMSVGPRLAEEESEPPLTVTERTINIPAELQTIAVAQDENSETVKIVVPRYFDGQDLSVHDFILHTEMGSNGTDDILFNNQNGQMKAVEDSTVTLTWVLRPPQTSFEGKLNIQLLVQGDEFKWHSLIGELTIAKHITGDPVVPATPSMYEQWLAEVKEQADYVRSQAANIQTVVDEMGAIKDAPAAAERAELAAEEAKQAVAEGKGFRTFFSAVTPDANGNLDPSRPMTVSPAASVEIESAGDRIQSVTAHGFTQQAGTGDPSPTNVRQLTNGGLKLAKITLDGSRNWQKSSSPVADSFFFADAIFAKDALIVCDGYENRTDKAVPSVYVDAFQQFIITPTAFGQTTLEQWKERLNQNPLTVYYQPSNLQTAALYAPVYIAGGEYRATCLPLTAPLCEGDSVVSWARSGCDKVMTFDGSEDEGWTSVGTAGVYATTISVDINTSVYNDGSVGPYISNYLVAQTTNNVYGAITANAFSVSPISKHVLVYLPQYSSVAELKAALAANPLTVRFRSTNYTESADIPVSLETHQQAVRVFDGTENWSEGQGSTSTQYQIFLSISDAAKSSAFLSDVMQNLPYSADNPTPYGNINQIGNFVLYLPKSEVSTIQAAKEYIAAHPITIVYQLATPVTYAHPAVVLEAATGDQLTYTVTGQSGGTVSVSLKPFQDGGHAKTADSATTAQNATQFDGHAWSEVPGPAPVQSVNSKTGTVTLGAEDVGAVPLNHTAVLADGIALKDGSPVNTPADIDQYTVLRIYSNYGAAVCSVPIKGGQTGFLPFINGTSAPNINIVVVNISRTETQLTLETNAALRLATTGITAPGTALSVYRIEGLV